MEESRYPKEVLERIYARRGRLHSFEALDPARTALLVVDLQVAFMEDGGATSLPAAQNVVPTVNRLAEVVRRTGGHVVWVVSTYGPSEQDRWSVIFDHVFGPEQGQRFREGLTEGAPGHAIWPELDVDADEPVVAKNRFGGFVGSAGRLEGVLRDLGVDTVLVVGTVTNICCESTAREAAMLDFKTIMVSDGNAGRCERDDIQTYAVFLSAFGDVMSSAELTTLLEAGVSSPSSGKRMSS